MKKTKQLFLIILFMAFMGPSLAHATAIISNVVYDQEVTAWGGSCSYFSGQTFTAQNSTIVSSVTVRARSEYLNNYFGWSLFTVSGSGSMQSQIGGGGYGMVANDPSFLLSSTATVYTIPNAYNLTYELIPGQKYGIIFTNSPCTSYFYLNKTSQDLIQNSSFSISNGTNFTDQSGELYISVNYNPPAIPTCFDGIQNQDETGIDTGGICTPAVIIAVVCADGIQNGDETGIDTGGRCKTHIIGFTPENGAFLTGPTVTFTMDVWTNPEDIGTFIGVNLNLHNIDQNVLLLNALSPSDIYLLDEFRVPSAGLYHYESTRAIGNGNYTLEATLSRAYLGGWIINPFSNINQTIAKHFIVGEGTFIGTVSQSGYDALNGTASGAVVPGTTIATVASNCNPFAGVFDIQKCGIYLFVPGGEYLNKTMKDMKAGLLTRAPWGYFYRVFDIWNNPTKGTIGAMVFPVYMGPGNTNNPGIEEITIDPGDMIAGAGALLDDIRDPHTHKNMKDVFGPMVQLTLALAVVFTIIADLTGSHKHDTGESKKKLS